MTLVRWAPRRGFGRGRLGFDRFFSDFEKGHGWRTAPRYATGGLALDVADRDESYVVTASLPGFGPDDVDISITERAVTVSAEAGKDDAPYLLRERYHGKLGRSVILPGEVNADEAVAEHKDGVLTLTLPKTVVERTKKIPVTTG